MGFEGEKYRFRGGPGLFGLGLALTWSVSAWAAPALMPMPRSVHTGEATLGAAGVFQIQWNGCRSEMLDRAASRFTRDVERQTGSVPQPEKTIALNITCGAAQADNALRENYRLAVDDKGVNLAVSGPVGVLRGLATLRQLIVPMGDGFAFSAAMIDDQPRFGWRGLSIDVARHFSSLATLKRQIDAMELVKLNVLHLHLSDHEGFRFESKAYPLLTEREAGKYYTQDQLRDLVAYAADRGIRIVPEIDMPGHSKAIITAYPDLAARPPAGTNVFGGASLNPASPETFRFLDTLLGELASVFPGQYVHIGGDELPERAWKGDPQIEALRQKEGLSSHDELQAYFHTRVRTILKKYGKTAMGWDEIASEKLPSDVVVQAWRGSKQTARVTGYGNPVVVSAGYYLDWLEGADKHYLVDPLDPTAVGMERADFETVHRLPIIGEFVHEPIVRDPSARMTAAQEKRVIGGEAAVWTELITEEMLDGRIWPRAAAVAERFWSPREVRDVPDMYRRLAVILDELRILGLQDAANQQRMLARLAPGNTQPVEILVSVLNSARIGAIVRPLKAALEGNMALAAKPLEFNVIASVAPADSLVARRFRADVDAYLGGERSLAQSLVDRLMTWQANHRQFKEVARGRPLLEAVLPVSQDLTALSEAGLQAINALENRKPMQKADVVKARTLLDRQAAAARASDGALAPFLSKDAPPVGDVLIAITPAISDLVGRAEHND